MVEFNDKISENMIKQKIPAALLKSKSRKEMWKNTLRILNTIEKQFSISSAYLLGSFTTKKRRPADVDFLILLQTKEKKAQSKWSVDLQISPDNK